MKKRHYKHILQWMVSGDSGISSIALVYAAIGIDHKQSYKKISYPHDPSDFGRCYRMLEALPWIRGRAFSQIMMDGHPVWQRMVLNWPRLEDQYRSEVACGTLPILYRMMREIIDES